MFLAEGEKVVRRAAAAGYPVRSFLMAPRWLESLSEVIEATDAPCYVLPESLAEEVTGFHVHRGALASLARLPLPSVQEVLAEARTVVVCEDMVDHTNVGAIFRSAAALGVDGVLLAARCADPLYRRSVKVAMGAVFALPWTRLPDWYDAMPLLARHGFTTVALTLADDARAALGGRGRTRQGRARARIGGTRTLAPVGTLRGPLGRHRDARGHRLAQRRRSHRGRLLRDVAENNSRTTVRNPYSCRVEWSPAEGPGFGDDLVDQVVDYAIIRLDPQGTIQTWNLGAERVKGYSPREAIGESFAMFYTDEDQHDGLPLSLLLQAREEGRVEHVGWRVRKDGTRFWGDVVITALRDSTGRLSGYAKVTRDLTQQHELEVALRSSEERLRLLVDQVVDYAIISLDPQGTIETWNLGAERVKGYSAQEAIGRSFAMFYPDEDRRAGLPMRLLSEARERGRVEHTGWRVRKDGSRFWGDVVITAIHDREGQVTGFAKVTRDRTDMKALEEAQDAFYAAFSHDFRTPITAIKGFVDAIRDSDVETRDELITRVEANADRLLTMVEGLVHVRQPTCRPGLAAARRHRHRTGGAYCRAGPGARSGASARAHRRGRRGAGAGQRGGDAPGGDQPGRQRAEVLTVEKSGGGRVRSSPPGPGPALRARPRPRHPSR